MTATRPGTPISPPLTLYLDGGAHTISSVKDAARFIRDHLNHPEVAAACPLLTLIEAERPEDTTDRVWIDFATWALVAGLTKPPS